MILKISDINHDIFLDDVLGRHYDNIKQLPVEARKQIFHEIQQSKYGFFTAFDIVDKPQGEQRQHNIGLPVWIDNRQLGNERQYSKGECYIKIAENKFLTWNYEG